MAHPAQRAFCSEVKDRFPEFFRGTRVLEVGSRNVNGTVRDLFEGGEFVGVDCAAGSGVDVICLGHEYDGEPDSFDVTCAVETFEHDPHAPQTTAHLLRLLRSGGLFFMTCAGEGRAEHGTRRTGNRYGPQDDFYRNVRLWGFTDWMRRAEVPLSEVYLRANDRAHDLYCWAIKG